MENIQTDVDRMITYLREYGNTDVDTLSKKLAIPRPVVEGWLHVLEEENLVQLEYKLTKLHAAWVGAAAQEEEEETPKKMHDIFHMQPEETVEIIEAQTPTGIRLAAEREGMPVPSSDGSRVQGSELRVPRPKTQDPRPETRNPKPGAYGADIGAIEIPEENGAMVGIGTVVVDVPKTREIKEEKRITPVTLVIKPEPKKSKSYANAKTKTVQIATPKEPDARSPEKSDRKTLRHEDLLTEDRRPETSKPASYVRLSEKYKSYLDLVNRQADELVKLRGEREKLYREGFLTLEKKFESELDAMTSKLLDNEKKVMELYNKAVSIPSRVVKLDENMMTLREMEAESENQLREARESISKRLAKKRRIVSSDLETLHALEEELQAGLERVKGVEKVNVRLQHIEDEINAQMAGAAKHLAESQKRVDELAASLAELRETKNRIGGETRRIKSQTAAEITELQGIGGELKRFDSLEQRLGRRLEEHERVLAEFKEFVRLTEGQYSELRDLVESQFVDKYAGELNSLLKSYEFSVNSLADRDQELARQANESKRRIIHLISDAKGIISEASRGKKSPDTERLEQLLGTRIGE